MSKSDVWLHSGMKKNEKLEANILTPTTKAADHDLPISGDEVCYIHTSFWIFHHFTLPVEGDYMIMHFIFIILKFSGS